MTTPPRDEAARSPSEDSTAAPPLDGKPRTRAFGALAIAGIIGAAVGTILHLRAMAIAGHELIAGWRQEGILVGLVAAAAIAAVNALLVSPVAIR